MRLHNVLCFNSAREMMMDVLVSFPARALILRAVNIRQVDIDKC